ncbi:MarR family winged helix-turn-helix transcriptional regulator [Cumulibacter soli]|uniref:MarR family winged helix-turn-helix transcriptional regulator n=1 Tax=Cumulibacter soli TaxID=2546344 RepID=UPI00106730C1|nr:MarR family winged helix-turn-helix transcriptional regulator [Cumulibacter soli]
MNEPLDPDTLAVRLAEVYRVLGPLYRRVSRLVTNAQPIMGMSMGVRAVLEHLMRDGEVSVPTIAATQEISRQFVQRMVHDARALGFVELVENPRHRRSSLVRITSEGRRAIGEVVEHERGLLGQVPGDLSDADLATTLRVLQNMLDGVAIAERLQNGTGDAGPAR